MMRFIGYFIIMFGLLFVSFGVGREVGRNECADQVEQMQIELEMSNIYKRLDGNLFFNEMCKDFCEEEFEKMAG